MKEVFDALTIKYQAQNDELVALSEKIDELKDEYQDKCRLLRNQLSEEMQEIHNNASEVERFKMVLAQATTSFDYNVWRRGCDDLSNIGFEISIPLTQRSFIITMRMPETGGYVMKYKESITKILPALEVTRYSSGEDTFDAKVIRIDKGRGEYRWLAQNLNTGRFTIFDGEEDNGILVASFGLLDSALQFILEKYGTKVDGRKKKW